MAICNDIDPSRPRLATVARRIPTIFQRFVGHDWLGFGEYVKCAPRVLTPLFCHYRVPHVCRGCRTRCSDCRGRPLDRRPPGTAGTGGTPECAYPALHGWRGRPGPLPAQAARPGHRRRRAARAGRHRAAPSAAPPPAHSGAALRADQQPGGCRQRTRGAAAGTCRLPGQAVQCRAAAPAPRRPAAGGLQREPGRTGSAAGE